MKNRMEKVMFGQKAQKISQLSSDVASFRTLYQGQVAANKALSDLLGDIRRELGIAGDASVFDAIGALKLDLSSTREVQANYQLENDAMKAFIQDTRVALSAKENEDVFELIAQLKWDISNLQGEVELLKSGNASLQERLDQAVAANLASNKTVPKKKAVKRKKG